MVRSMLASFNDRLLLRDNKHKNLDSELVEEPVPQLDRNERSQHQAHDRIEWCGLGGGEEEGLKMRIELNLKCAEPVLCNFTRRCKNAIRSMHLGFEKLKRFSCVWTTRWRYRISI